MVFVWIKNNIFEFNLVCAITINIDMCIYTNVCVYIKQEEINCPYSANMCYKLL
jgi:low affinity Fe/Cu permease